MLKEPKKRKMQKNGARKQSFEMRAARSSAGKVRSPYNLLEIAGTTWQASTPAAVLAA